MDKNTITKQALTAAAYAALTWALPALSYGPIQFRISEVMTLLAFFNPQYIVGLTLGCALANMFSALGVVDVVVGTFASFLALYTMSKIKNIWVASLMPAVFSVIIGIEIAFLASEMSLFIPVTLQIMFSEFVIVTLLGVPLFKILEKNKSFRNVVLDIPAVEKSYIKR